MIVWPGSIASRASASSIIARATRSLMEPVGFSDSSFAHMRTSGFGDSRVSSTNGVFPIALTISARPGFLKVRRRRRDRPRWWRVKAHGRHLDRPQRSRLIHDPQLVGQPNQLQDVLDFVRPANQREVGVTLFGPVHGLQDEAHAGRAMNLRPRRSRAKLAWRASTSPRSALRAVSMCVKSSSPSNSRIVQPSRSSTWQRSPRVATTGAIWSPAVDSPFQ